MRTILAITVIHLSLNPFSFAGPAPTTQPIKELKIDMDKAVAIALPPITAELKPHTFKTSDGKEGWLVQIPGQRPIATPAYASIDGRGMLFVGGGYGSHEFYAFDAQSGQKIWEIKTADDGPSAAVVEDSYVAFNTESCTVIVVKAKTGELVWQEWLGDPLMSQPAISKGRLYMAYPAGGKKGANLAADQAGAAPPKTSHKLLCADLKTGHHLWEQDIDGDVISAPIIAGEQIFLTCFSGTSFCLASADGAVVWRKENSGTSAPVIAEGQVVLAQKEMRAGATYEGLRRLNPANGHEKDATQLAQARAEYLKPGAKGNSGLPTTQAAALDAAVGFAQAPQAAGLASAGVNISTVAQGWAFQGSKAAYNNGRLLNAQANVFNCVSSTNGQMNWRAICNGAGITDTEQLFAPPALGEKNMYLCSSQGHLISVGQADGRIAFNYATHQPMAFQPALAGGNIYAATASGMIICLKTKDPDADGWTAWGGNAQHNKIETRK